MSEGFKGASITRSLLRAGAGAGWAIEGWAIENRLISSGPLTAHAMRSGVWHWPIADSLCRAEPSIRPSGNDHIERTKDGK